LKQHQGPTFLLSLLICTIHSFIHSFIHPFIHGVIHPANNKRPTTSWPTQLKPIYKQKQTTLNLVSKGKIENAMQNVAENVEI